MKVEVLGPFRQMTATNPQIDDDNLEGDTVRSMTVSHDSTLMATNYPSSLLSTCITVHSLRFFMSGSLRQTNKRGIGLNPLRLWCDVDFNTLGRSVGNDITHRHTEVYTIPSNKTALCPMLTNSCKLSHRNN